MHAGIRDYVADGRRRLHTVLFPTEHSPGMQPCFGLSGGPSDTESTGLVILIASFIIGWMGDGLVGLGVEVKREYCFSPYVNQLRPPISTRSWKSRSGTCVELSMCAGCSMVACDGELGDVLYGGGIGSWFVSRLCDSTGYN
jgi:hypothetical protein